LQGGCGGGGCRVGVMVLVCGGGGDRVVKMD